MRDRNLVLAAQLGDGLHATPLTCSRFSPAESRESPEPEVRAVFLAVVWFKNGPDGARRIARKRMRSSPEFLNEVEQA